MYPKASGYKIDRITAVETGRDLFAAGVVAVERMDNLALSLCLLLTTTAKAEGMRTA